MLYICKDAYIYVYVNDAMYVSDAINICVCIIVVISSSLNVMPFSRGNELFLSLYLFYDFLFHEARNFSLRPYLPNSCILLLQLFHSFWH